MSLRGVAFRYGEAEALHAVDLEVEAGEALALIGTNGSGKSTILRILSGLAFPSAGTYFFRGQEINQAAMADRTFAKSYHRRVGVLFQNSDAQLFCPSVREEIAFGPRQMGLPEAEVEVRTHSLLSLLGIAGLAERVPYHLSGGERKRVALAAVLSLNPEVLVLDEPLNGLDPKTKGFLRDLLMGLRERGTTIVAATHDFDHVRGLFGRAAVLSAAHRVDRVGLFDEIVGDRPYLEGMNIV